MTKKLDKMSDDLKEDTFNYLGFGMVAFRDLMWTLIWLFAVLSLIMTPAIYIYRSYDVINTPIAGYSQYSLGNLGYTSSRCTRVPYDAKKITLSCDYGAVTKISNLGIMPGGSTDRNACFRTEQNAKCTD